MQNGETRCVIERAVDPRDVLWLPLAPALREFHDMGAERRATAFIHQGSAEL